MRLTLLVLLVSAAVAGATGSARAQPQLPSTIYGSASIDGKPVPDGTQVRGYIDGNDCTQPSGLTGTVTDGSASGFVINVMHETQRAGCGKEGKTITFTIDGRAAPQSAAWKIGIQRVDLNTGQGQPIALPTFTPAAAVSPTTASTAGAGNTAPASTAARPTGPLPTDDVHFGKTPKPPGARPPTQTGGSGGPPVVAFLVVGLALLAAGGGVAGYLLSRRNHDAGEDTGEPPSPSASNP